jgi:recombination protein RecT
MENQNKLVTVKGLLSQENVRAKFTEILRENAPAAMANLAIMVNNSAALSKCQPMTIISAAVIAATLKLPLDPNLGYAYVIPYGDKAQFQVGAKGFTQLAWRTGQYKTLNVVEVCEGELVSHDKFRGEYILDESKKTSDKIIGYYAFFKLINGGEKGDFWSVDKITKHANRFSQMYKRGSGLWKDDFDGMAKKTVMKNLLAKWGILSVDMQFAVKFDQGVVKDIDTEEVEYLDNEPVHTIEETPQALKVETPKPTEGKLL